ncbi:MAG: NAD(P)H-binding protein [Chroococcidiopsidaceae cyanobacterium CP_BM_ER_R8_30]|nr:NAD(P)H-binding protein [Chroococcidiopsidaceae cyanobacterium CP_BM_ER_R8_30]
MKLVLFGPTGMIGSRILNEALSRGHMVTAITRDPSRFSVSHENLTVVAGNALAPASVAEVAKNHDAVLSAIGTSGSSLEVIVEAARSLIKGLSLVRIRRLVVVGGAGVLEVEPGCQFVDSPNFFEPYRSLALVHREAYNLYKTSDLDWTFVCPAAEIAPGERTGKFHVGADHLLTNEKGESQISAEDYAIAFVDEVETSQYIRHRLTVAY